MKLFFKSLMLVVLMQSQMTFAEMGKSKVVKGNSAMYIAFSETCQYEKLHVSLQEDADRNCFYFAGFKTHAIKIEVLKEWEAFPPHCAQDGTCGYRHECILSWQATCEVRPPTEN